jgi:hypothetical protein
MFNSAPRTLLVFLLATTLFGCASAPDRELSREQVPYALLPNGHDPLNPEEFLPDYVASYVALEKGAINYFESRRGHALNILEISGGGQNGAFGAGFLKGWRGNGTRPQFDGVTGVSTGALLATHAFLGTAADDAILEEVFTQTDQDDIYRKKNLLAAALGGNSLLDVSPFEALIAKYITDEVLERVAAAYDDDRRLLIGTTNLDYGQTWVWNMGLIAKEGKLELYRKVLQASSSFPIAFPPVEIDGYLFADGATRANVLAVGLTGTHRPAPPLYGPGNIYLIHNGKGRAAPAAVKDELIDLAGTGVGVMMESSMEGVVLRAFFAARAHGYNFNMVSIPAEADIGSNALAFNPAQMRAGFDAGMAMWKQGDPWIHTPPPVGDVPGWQIRLIEDIGVPEEVKTDN